jgi:8-oxo-dGTP diphosphatase
MKPPRGSGCTPRVFGRIEARAAMNLPVIDVAACIVQSPDGCVLLAQRTARQIAAGFWELPGGKVEPGESTADAAVRELQEETGLTPRDLVPWMNYEHQFATKRLRLHFFRARSWEGTPHGHEGQRLAWVDPHAPHVGPVLSSNDRALFTLSLPPAYIIADFHARDCADDFLARLHGELSNGAKLIRLRVSAVSPGQTVALLARVAALAEAFPDAHILTTSTMDARRAGFAGVHSCTRELRRLTTRPPVRIWAATCHDDADLGRAMSLGVDFVVLSPILPDPERPGDTPFGWDGLRRVAAAFPARVYAQGGLTAEQIPAVRHAGAAGVVSRIAKPPDSAGGTYH